MTERTVNRVVFLDIDGVILPIGACSGLEIEQILRHPNDHLDVLVSRVSQEAVIHLRALAITHSVKFVVISTWRRLFEEVFIEAFLARLELAAYLHKDWCAPMLGIPPVPVKGRDIGMWLGRHRKTYVRNCLVIDDDDLELHTSWGFRDLRQLRPKSEAGFVACDMQVALEHFAPVSA